MAGGTVGSGECRVMRPREVVDMPRAQAPMCVPSRGWGRRRGRPRGDVDELDASCSRSVVSRRYCDASDHRACHDLHSGEVVDLADRLSAAIAPVFDMPSGKAALPSSISWTPDRLPRLSYRTTKWIIPL
jgi:hypothetical protein